MNFIKRAVLKEAQAKQHDERSAKHELRWIELEITRRCPLACLHCGSSCDEKQFYEKELSTDEILAFLKQIDKAYGASNVMLCLTGGEPLMRKDIFHVIAQATELGYRTTMVSNGMLINQENIKLLAAAGLSTITISLDGLEATHNWARGHKESFKRAIEGLRLLKKSNYFHVVEALTCVSQRTLEELSEIYQLLKQVKIDRWRLTRIFPIGRALEYPELILDNKQLKKLLDFIQKLRNSDPTFLTYGEEGYLGKKYDFLVRDCAQHCDAGVHILTLLADGSITGCAAVSHSLIQGDIKNDDPVELWENHFKPFRDRSWMQKGVCGDCDKFRYCQGDGMHLWEPNKKDPADCVWQKLK